MKVMRSILYVPGNNEALIQKAPGYKPDIVTLDLEDSVPPAEKKNAREISRRNVKFLVDAGMTVYARLNNWETGLTNDDCEAIVVPGLSGVCLAKTGTVDHVKRLDWKLEEMEMRQGIKVGTVEVQLLIETARGMSNAFNCAAGISKRVNSMIFGAVDYTTDMRVPLNQPIGEEQKWARARVACACRANGLIAIDCPYVGFKDTEGFEADTAYAHGLGFEGRMLIHPAQIPIAHKVYTPAPERVAWAKQVVEVFEKEGIAKGSASVTLNGHMVDTPVYTGAKQILEMMAQIEGRGK